MAKTNKQRFEKFYCTVKGRAGHLLNNAKQRARRYGLEYSINYDWLKPKLERGLCEVTGIPLVLKINGGKGHADNSFSPSLERKDNALGYTQDNTQLVCWIYNRAKGAFPITDLITLALALERRTPICPVSPAP